MITRIKERRKTRYDAEITAKIDRRTRNIIDEIAVQNQVTMGTAVRILLSEAIEMRGIE